MYLIVGDTRGLGHRIAVMTNGFPGGRLLAWELVAGVAELHGGPGWTRRESEPPATAPATQPSQLARCLSRASWLDADRLVAVLKRSAAARPRPSGGTGAG
jgi:hypothetical protein